MNKFLFYCTFLLFVNLFNECVSLRKSNVYCPTINGGQFQACENGFGWRSIYGGSCIRKEHFCDNIFDCSDGSDEKYCSYNYNYGYKSGFSYKFIRGNCPSDYYLCQNRGIQYTLEDKLNITDKVLKNCVKESWICDGIKHCIDGSDEKYCPYNFSTGFNYNFEQDNCEDGYFKCRSNVSRQCIRKSWLCDDYIDCDDASDENYCPYFTKPEPRDIYSTTREPRHNTNYDDEGTENYSKFRPYYVTRSPRSTFFIDPLSVANCIITFIIIIILGFLLYNLYHKIKIQDLRNKKYYIQSDEPTFIAT